MARAVRLVGLIASSPGITDLTKGETDIRRWEDHQRMLAKRFRESFSDTVRVGILLQMLPEHEFVLQTLRDEVKYYETVERMRAFVAHRVAKAEYAWEWQEDLCEGGCRCSVVDEHSLLRLSGSDRTHPWAGRWRCGEVVLAGGPQRPSGRSGPTEEGLRTPGPSSQKREREDWRSDGGREGRHGDRNGVWGRMPGSILAGFATKSGARPKVESNAFVAVRRPSRRPTTCA